jgi:CrcB protein
MQSFLLVFLGAGLGGALRHGVNMAALRVAEEGFPWGTLFINAAGSLVMGLFAGFFAFKAGEGSTQSLRLFLMTGMLGGFTTFSAFSFETILLWERGEAASALLYVVASVVLALVGLFLGLSVVRSFS